MMDELNFAEDCQALVEKGQESWKSYFDKWETFAKLDEEDPENDSAVDTTTFPKKKKVRKKSGSVKPKRQSASIHKKNGRLRKMDVSLNSPQKKETVVCDDTNTKNKEDEFESVLKTIILKFLKDENKSDVVAVMSQTYSDSQKTNSLYLAKQSSAAPSIQLHLHQSSISSDVRKSHNSENLGVFSDITLKNNSNYLLPRIKTSGLCWQRPKTTLAVRGSLTPHYQKFTASPSRVDEMELTPVRPRFSDFPSRKINRECFINRSFSKMNITLDEKRLRDLSLHKRTNSVNLNMENSRLITPERKPPARKCLSENISRRKRRRRSKLFFDEEESGSDDQTKTKSLVIHLKNKSQVSDSRLQKGDDSDSDDCDVIFDRMGGPLAAASNIVTRGFGSTS